MNEKRISRKGSESKQTPREGKRLLSKKLAGKILDEAIQRIGSSASREKVLQTAGKIVLEASEMNDPRFYNLKVSLDDITLEKYSSVDEALAVAERRVICAALEAIQYRRGAAKMLGISEKSLKYRMDKYEIPFKDTRRRDRTQDVVFEPFGLDEVLGGLEIKLIKPALVKSENITEAAKLLGITVRSLRYRIAKYGLDAGIDL